VEIVYKKLADIKPYGNNPRINDSAVGPVAESIREFGFKVPIVIDSNGVIAAGHTRLKAAALIGLETVPCIIADDLNDKQIRAYRLADNKTAEIADWDYELLDIELGGIIEIDMGAFGFTYNTEDQAIDLNGQDTSGDSNFEECHCPKCGFVFRVGAAQ